MLLGYIVSSTFKTIKTYYGPTCQNVQAYTQNTTTSPPQKNSNKTFHI